jgi:hypothetical protein
MTITNEYIIIAMLFLAIAIGALIILLWFIEFRFTLRRRIKSFDDYGRKRTLLRISEKAWIRNAALTLAIGAVIALVIFLAIDFYYYWPALLPIGTLTLSSTALFVQNKALDNLSIDTRYLDEEYLRIVDWEKNLTEYLQSLNDLTVQVNREIIYYQELFSNVNQNFKTAIDGSDVQSRLTVFNNKISRQINSLDGSVDDFKQNFTLIVKEYIENKNMSSLKLLDENNLISLNEYESELSLIVNDTIQFLSEQIISSLLGHQLKTFSKFPNILEILKTLNYSLTLQDIITTLEVYPIESDADRSVFLDTIYAHGFITFDFLSKYIIPKDEAWFFNETFYATFSEADVKKLFYIILESDAINIIKSILRRLKPKYISYLQDLCNIHVFNPELELLIGTYDDLITRMNQSTNIYNIEENLLIALIRNETSKTEKQELEKLLSRDLSTPSISKVIIDKYNVKLSELEDLINLVVDTYFMYTRLTKNTSQSPIIKLDALMSYLLEKISLLDASAVKIGLLFLILDLFSQKVQWYLDSASQDIVQSLVQSLKLEAKMKDFDGYLIQEPKRVFTDLILHHELVKTIGTADLHSLIMKIEAKRLLLEEIN